MVETQQNERAEQPDRRKPPEGDERIMTLTDLSQASEREMITAMQRSRTLTPAQVDRNTARHDINDLTPAERATFDTGSMRRLEI